MAADLEQDKRMENFSRTGFILLVAILLVGVLLGCLDKGGNEMRKKEHKCKTRTKRREIRPRIHESEAYESSMSITLTSAHTKHNIYLVQRQGL